MYPSINRFFISISVFSAIFSFAFSLSIARTCLLCNCYQICYPFADETGQHTSAKHGSWEAQVYKNRSSTPDPRVCTQPRILDNSQEKSDLRRSRTSRSRTASWAGLESLDEATLFSLSFSPLAAAPLYAPDLRLGTLVVSESPSQT